MQVNRGLVFWGVAFITAGALALAIQSGAISAESARVVWQFWPVALIVIGIAIVAARTPLALITTLLAGVVVGGMAGTLVTGWPDDVSVGCGGEPDQSITDDGDLGERATVDLDFSCGDLDVSTADGSDWSVDARYAGSSEPEISATDSSLRVAGNHNDAFVFGESRHDWEVVLPTDPSIDLSIDANAASSDLDLAGGTFTSLQIDANAGDVNVNVPGASVEGFSLDANAGSIRIVADDSTRLRGSVELNAGSLELCVPDSVDLVITVDDGDITFSHNLDESDLSREGDTWVNGSRSDPAITLDVSGNAASFELNPEDGCS